MRTVATALVFACVLFGGPRQGPVWEEGKVLAQDLGAARVGVYAGRVGSGVFAVPLVTSWNRITIETATEIYELAERGRGRIIVPVNGTIPFYREGSLFILLDLGRKKHKFFVVGIRAL